MDLDEIGNIQEVLGADPHASPPCPNSMNTLADIARERHAKSLTEEEIEALGRRHLPYAEAVEMVCREMHCARSSFYKHYRDILRPFTLGGPHSTRFCWEDEVLRAIAGVKRAA